MALFVLLWLIFRNVLSAGELISTQVILNTMFGPLQQLSGFILQYREAEASLQSFEQLMARPSETRPAEPVEIGGLEEIRFADVVFRYRNELCSQRTLFAQREFATPLYLWLALIDIRCDF